MSLLKSSKTQEAPASALDPVPAPAGHYRKPHADLYTVLLVVALIAVLIGILFLYLEMGTYEFKFQGGPPVGMASSHPSTVVESASAIIDCQIVHVVG